MVVTVNDSRMLTIACHPGGILAGLREERAELEDGLAAELADAAADDEKTERRRWGVLATIADMLELDDSGSLPDDIDAAEHDLAQAVLAHGVDGVVEGPSGFSVPSLQAWARDMLGLAANGGTSA